VIKSECRKAQHLQIAQHQVIGTHQVVKGVEVKKGARILKVEADQPPQQMELQEYQVQLQRTALGGVLAQWSFLKN